MEFVIQPLETEVFDNNQGTTNIDCTINTVQECGCVHNHVPGCGAPKNA